MQSTNLDPSAREHIQNNVQVDTLFNGINSIIDGIAQLIEENNQMDGKFWTEQIMDLLTGVASSAVIGLSLSGLARLGQSAEKMIDIGRYKPKGNLAKDTTKVWEQFQKHDVEMYKLAEDSLQSTANYAKNYDQIQLMMARDQRTLQEFSKLHPNFAKAEDLPGQWRSSLGVNNLSSKHLDKADIVEQMIELKNHGIRRPMEEELFNHRFTKFIDENGQLSSNYFDNLMKHYGTVNTQRAKFTKSAIGSGTGTRQLKLDDTTMFKDYQLRHMDDAANRQLSEAADSMKKLTPATAKKLSGKPNGHAWLDMQMSELKKQPLDKAQAYIEQLESENKMINALKLTDGPVPLSRNRLTETYNNMKNTKEIEELQAMQKAAKKGTQLKGQEQGLLEDNILYTDPAGNTTYDQAIKAIQEEIAAPKRYYPQRDKYNSYADEQTMIQRNMYADTNGKLHLNDDVVHHNSKQIMEEQIKQHKLDEQAAKQFRENMFIDNKGNPQLKPEAWERQDAKRELVDNKYQDLTTGDRNTIFRRNYLGSDGQLYATPRYLKSIYKSK